MTAQITEMKEDPGLLALIVTLIIDVIGQLTLIVIIMIIGSRNTLAFGNVVFTTIMPKCASTNLICNVGLATFSAIKQDTALKTEVLAM